MLPIHFIVKLSTDFFVQQQSVVVMYVSLRRTNRGRKIMLSNLTRGIVRSNDSKKSRSDKTQ